MIFSRGVGINKLLCMRLVDIFYAPPLEFFLHGIWLILCQNHDQLGVEGGKCVSN